MPGNRREDQNNVSFSLAFQEMFFYCRRVESVSIWAKTQHQGKASVKENAVYVKACPSEFIYNLSVFFFSFFHFFFGYWVGGNLLMLACFKKDFG